MKNILLFLLGLALSAQAAPVASQLIDGNKGQVIPLFGSARNSEPIASAIVNLDTSEIDTSKYFYNLLGKPVSGMVDTVGFVHFATKDSTGSDSSRVRVVWFGNPQADGRGVWSRIDSVTASGNALTSFTAATPTPVVNSKGYMALMFTVSNPSVSAVALKSAATGLVLTRRYRLVSINQ